MSLDSAKSIRFPDDTGRSLNELIATCPPGMVVELAPGRFEGPVVIRSAITLRGAGDLTRVSGGGAGPVIVVDVDEGEVVLESLHVEDGSSERGGGLTVLRGSVKAHNVQFQACRSEQSGGAIHVADGSLEATRIRIHDVTGHQGGAICAQGSSSISVRDSQMQKSEAHFGGAVAALGSSRVVLEGLTIGRSRATTPSGGQAIYVLGAKDCAPQLIMRRVRLEDVPLGMPIVVDSTHPGEVSVTKCDMPRVVQGAPGVIDGGENNWR